MQKYRDQEVKSFEFSDLQGSHVVSQTKFEGFEFKTLNGESVTSQNVSAEDIRSERTFAKKNNFKIDDTVREYRGLSRQEQDDLEQKIQAEVQKRLEAAYQEAYQEGLQRGQEEGKAEALASYQETLTQNLESLTSVITEVQAHSEKLYKDNQKEIYDFVKRFTKWIVMKEIDEKVYLQNLLEKLILELNARKNLIIKVGKNNFAQMPEVLQIVESRLGQLVNVRVEIVPEIEYPGIILEAENGLIDGSLEGIFENIDKIFEQVVKHE